jgi:hypothetical protein
MLHHRLAATLCVLTVASLGGRPAHAQIVLTLPDFSGPFIGPAGPFPQPPLTVGTFAYAIPAGQSITSATVAGAWGNAQQAFATAGVDVFLDGILVARCLPLAPDCWELGAPLRRWTFTFGPAQLAALADGSALLTAVQTNNDVIRLGQPTLTLLVGPTAAVPEPATLSLVGAGIAVLILGARHNRRSRPAPGQA